MIDRFKLVEVSEMIQRFSDLGQHDLAQKLRDETKKFEGGGGGRSEQLIKMRNVIQEFCDKGQLDLARKQYEKAKKLIKRYGDEQLELRYIITPTLLLHAYLKAGEIEEAFKLFHEAYRDLAERCEDEDKELQEACLAFSEINDVWKLYEEAKKFAEKCGDKQLQRWLLETIAASCYVSISLDHTRKLHEGAKKSIERYGDEEPRRRRGQDLIYAYANVLKPDQAFKLFHEAYRDLAEMYEDKELQEACLVFSEVNDVWKLYEEAKKLAEKYRDKQLQRQFLDVIAGFCGESIIYYSKTGKIDKAQVLYDDLKQLVETHGERQPELWVRQAKGAVNLIYTYVTANKPDEAQTVYGELRKLAEDHPGEPKLRVWQANRASDVIYAYATAEKLDEAQAVYGELRKLAEDDPDESRLRVWQAEGAFDLTYVYAKAGKCDEAREMFQELEELVSDKDVGEEIWKQKIDEMPMMDWLRQLLKERCV